MQDPYLCDVESSDIDARRVKDGSSAISGVVKPR